MNILLLENKTEDKWLYDRLTRLLSAHNIIIEEVSEGLTASYYFDTLSKLKEQKQKIDLFLIPVSLGKIHSEFLGLKLGLLIRLAFEFQQYCFKDIIFIGAETKDELLKYSSFAQLLNTNASYYCRYSFDEIKDSLSQIQSFSNEEIIKSLISKIILEKPPMKGRHSVANEWAIYRMAEFLGILEINSYFQSSLILNNPYFRLKLLEISLQSSFPKNIGIKNLFKDIKIEKSKFLLIDDKSDLGWEKIIEFLIEKLNNENTLFSIANFPDDKNKFEKDIEDILKKIELNNYDLIFLDLRLLSSEENKSFKEITEIENFSGAKILTQIKNKFPALPVIIFTASQQAWNLEKLYEIGADAYFIKESPENIFSNEIFYDNLRNFIQVIVELTEKGKVLKWFYQNSETIKNKLDEENYSTNIKERIKQKLDLAFGIIRARRREYDKKFIYSDYQFAFLVYWSMLIEFQSEKIGTYNGEDDNFSFLNGTVFINKNKSNIQRLESGIKSLKWSQKFKYKNMPNISLSSRLIDISSDKKYFRNLSIIIPSFILLAYGNSNSDIVNEFIYLNEIRNKLDYTHSDQHIVKKQPIHTQANEEEDLLVCQDMFKFIFFLYTKNKI